MRIFVPVTPAALRAAAARGSLGPVGVAFAVTGADLTADDEEELALEATEAAAWRSLHLLAAEAGDGLDGASGSASASASASGSGSGSATGPAAAGRGSTAAPDRVSPDLRRVVLTVDLPEVAVLPVAPPDPLAAEGAVVPIAAIALDAVVSVLADGASLGPVLAAALPAVLARRTAADLEDPDLVTADPALAALDEVLATPLLWFDAVELPHLFGPSPSPAVRGDPDPGTVADTAPESAPTAPRS